MSDLELFYRPSLDTDKQRAIYANGGSTTFSGDFTGDGYKDIIFFNDDWPRGEVLTDLLMWRYDPASGRYVADTTTFPDSGFMSFPNYASDIVDFNGDGEDDLFIATNGDEWTPGPGGGGYDHVFLSSPDGYRNVSDQPALDHENWGHGTSTGDIDNDGDTDVFVSGAFGGRYPSYGLINDGKGQFTYSTDLPGDHGSLFTSAVFASSFADLNNDGLEDMIVGHASGPPAVGLDESGNAEVSDTQAGTPAHILLANPDGGHRQKIELPSENIAQLYADSVDVKAFDIEGDGDLDLLLSNYNVGGWYVDGDGKVRWSSEDAIEINGETVPHPSPHDKAFTKRGIQLFVNDGEANFTPASERIDNANSLADPYIQWFDVIDVDADGDLDLFGATRTGRFQDFTTSVWLNDGSGNFAAQSNADILGDQQIAGLWNLTPIDYDHDGDWDAVHSGADWGDSFPDDARPTYMSFLENTGEPDGRYGGSADRDLLKGTDAGETFYLYAGNDRAFGHGGDDTFVLGHGRDEIDGGAGLDRVRLQIGREDIDVTRESADRTTLETPVGSKALTGIERIETEAGTLAMDASAAQVYRLYQAAFDRTPDEPGLGYWIEQMDAGADFVNTIAASFVGSDEFRDLYGEEPSDTAFAEAIYANVLSRDPDAEGLAFWVNELDSGNRAREQVLADFAESPENKALTVDQTSDGVWYI